jgi:DNA polymerase III gamma/tau subunit
VQLLDALAAEDGATMLGIADSMADRSLSFAGALQDLGSLLHKVALAQAVPASVQDEWPEAEDVRRLAGSSTRRKPSFSTRLPTLAAANWRWRRTNTPASR